MDENTLKTILEGDQEAAKFVVDNFDNVALIDNRTKAMREQYRDF